MNSQKEIYEALIRGEKVAHEDWGSNEYLTFSKAGTLVDERNRVSRYTFSYPKCWHIWKKPKAKKWVNLYLDESNCNKVCGCMHSSKDKAERAKDPGKKLLACIEIEVDEE